VLHLRGRVAQLAAVGHGQTGRAAAAVVGHEHVLARRIHDHVAGAGALRGFLVQEGQLPGCGVDGERADRASRAARRLADFSHGKEEPPVGVDRQEGGIGDLGSQPGKLELAGGLLQMGQVDPLASALRVGAHVDPERAAAARGPGLCRRGAKAQTGQNPSERD